VSGRFAGIWASLVLEASLVIDCLRAEQTDVFEYVLLRESSSAIDCLGSGANGYLVDGCCCWKLRCHRLLYEQSRLMYWVYARKAGFSMTPRTTIALTQVHLGSRRKCVVVRPWTLTVDFRGSQQNLLNGKAINLRALINRLYEGYRL
jgi:hypothetical protein